MILSVVVPKLQKGQWERIDEEFRFVDYELIIQKNITKALEQSSGRFILFLEEDSAFEKGQLNNSLDIFRFNDSYRKLAMVSSRVDFNSIKEPVCFSYKDGVKLIDSHGDSQYPVSVGYMYGAIIRTTTLRKVVLSDRKDNLYRSVQFCDYLWSNGLRVELNPKSVYYAPVTSTLELDSFKIKPTAVSIATWEKESIL